MDRMVNGWLASTTHIRSSGRQVRWKGGAEPALASRSAVAAPMPDEAPVMSATLLFTMSFLDSGAHWSPFFEPWSQHYFERPGRSMLPMQLQIGLGDAVRVGHIVVDARSGETMRTGTV